MKYLKLLLLGLINTVICFAQFPVNSTQSSPSTNNVFKGAISAQKGIVSAVYNDTTAANADSYVKTVPHILITTKNNSIWKRSATANRWLLVSAGAAQQCIGIQNGGIVAWSGGLSFNVTSATYCINSNIYNSLSGGITLNTANSTLPRIDVIGLDTNNNIIKITGVPAANPAIPQVNLLSQLYLTSILIPANSTIPGGVTSTTVYDENTEWATSFSGSISPNFNNLINPFRAVKAINVANPTNGRLFFTNATPISSANLGLFNFYINNQEINISSLLTITLTLSGVPVTNEVIINSSFGYTQQTGVYQNVSIPRSSFIFNNSNSFDGIKFNFTNSPDLYIDYITLQGGITNTTSPYITDIYRKQASDSVFKVINGVSVFAFKDSAGGSGSGIAKPGTPNTIALYDNLGTSINSAVTGQGINVTNGVISTDVAKLPTVTAINTYSGKSTSLIITDENRGGVFNYYTGSGAVDNGMVFLDATSRKWKRQLTSNRINIRWYGAIPRTPDNSFDNDIYPAFIAAREYVRGNKGLVIYVPSTGTNIYGYYCSQTLSFVNMDIAIEGENIGATGHNTYSTIHFPFNTMGFDMNCTIQGEYYATIKNLKLDGRGAGGGIAYDITKHGIQSNISVNFENIFLDNFSGDGFNISGFAGTLGNSDRSQFVNCMTSECNNGFFMSGYDANTMVFNNCAGDNNRRWAFYDNGFLGNLYLNCNAANNGTQTQLPAFVRARYKGVNYIPITNDLFNNTNVKPDLNPDKWMIFDNGIAQPLWDSTKRYYSGGSFCSVDPSAAHVYVGNYVEDYQPPVRMGERALVLGGQQNTVIGGGFLTAYAHALVARSEIMFEKKIKFGKLISSPGYIDYEDGTPAVKNVNIGADVAQGPPNIKFFADLSTQISGQNMASKQLLTVSNYTLGANVKTFLAEQISDDPTSKIIEAKAQGQSKFSLYGNGRLSLLNYNSPTAFTGTPVANLQVDAQGNMITGALGGGTVTDTQYLRRDINLNTTQTIANASAIQQRADSARNNAGILELRKGGVFVPQFTLPTGGGGTTYTFYPPLINTGGVVNADTAKAQGKLATYNDVLTSSKWTQTGNDIINNNSGKVNVANNFQIGTDGGGVKFQTIAGYNGIWFNQAAPDFTNYAFLYDYGIATTQLNGVNAVEIRVANDYQRSVKFQQNGVTTFHGTTRISPIDANNLVFSINGAAAQVADLMQINNNAGGNLFKVNNLGNLYVANLATGLTAPTTTGTIKLVTTDINGVLSNTPLSSIGWSLTGNSGTDTTVNFIGTTDLKAFKIRTNNKDRVIVDTTGNVLIFKNLNIDGNISSASNVSCTNLTTSGSIAMNGKLVQMGVAAINTPYLGLAISGPTPVVPSSQTYGGYGFVNDGTSSWFQGLGLSMFTSPGPDITSISPLERMRITSTGNVLIGTTSNIPSSKLTVESTTQGILLPRLTTTQRNAIASPAAGLEVYNTTTNSKNFYNGSVWASVAGITKGQYTTTASATSTFTVTLGETEANNTYNLAIAPTSVMAGASYYISAKTTTSFDITYLTAVTGSLSLDWTLFK